MPSWHYRCLKKILKEHPKSSKSEVDIDFLNLIFAFADSVTIRHIRNRDHVQNCWCRSPYTIMRSPQMKFPSFISVLPGDALTTLQSIECKPCRHILLKHIHVSEAPTKIFGISECGKVKEELIKKQWQPNPKFKGCLKSQM